MRLDRPAVRLLTQVRREESHHLGDQFQFRIGGLQQRVETRELHAALKPRGVLFSSNPRGANEEGWNRGRYGAYHDLEAWRRYLTAAGFAELEHYYRPPGLPREQQPWLASVWRRR